MTARVDRALGLDSGSERTVSLYGVAVRSSFRFANRMVPAEGPGTVRFVASLEGPDVADWHDAPVVFQSFDRLDDGRPRVSVVQAATFQIVRIAGLSDYYLWDDAIWCHLLDRDHPYTVEIHLLGLVLCYWLEQRGIRVLHASAVATEHGAVGFIAGNKSGKSSLAAALMERGLPLLTDDFLALNCEAVPIVAYPGYPQMRMWPDQARRFLGSEEGFPQVHPALSKRRVPVGEAGGLGTFHPEATTVRALYLPERADEGVDTPVDVVALSPRDAVIELVARSFLGPMLEGIGLEATRFASFVQLARSVPVRRLRYPDGSALLDRVVDRIATDLSASDRLPRGGDDLLRPPHT